MNDRVRRPISKYRLPDSAARRGNVIGDSARERVPNVVVGRATFRRRIARRRIQVIGVGRSIVDRMRPGIPEQRLQTVREAAKRAGVSLQWVETGTSSDEAFQRSPRWPWMAAGLIRW